MQKSVDCFHFLYYYHCGPVFLECLFILIIDLINILTQTSVKDKNILNFDLLIFTPVKTLDVCHFGPFPTDLYL